MSYRIGKLLIRTDPIYMAIKVGFEFIFATDSERISMDLFILRLSLIWLPDEVVQMYEDEAA